MTPRQRIYDHLRAICEQHGTTLDELLSRCRTPNVLAARIEAVNWLVYTENKSMVQAGRILHRCPSAVSHLAAPEEERRRRALRMQRWYVQRHEAGLAI